MRWLLSAGVLAIAVLCANAVLAAEVEAWPDWRGPHGNGVSDSATAPIAWSRDENVAWRTPLPGPAGSTPVVWGDRVFLTSSDGPKLVLKAIAAADGAELWTRTVTTGDRGVRGDEGNLASPSPVTDGERVIALMGDGRLACFSMAGDPLWSLDLQDKYGRFDIAFGYTSSPLLRDGRLYVQMIHGDGNPATQEARVACLDAATGDQVWSVKRVTGASRECEHAYTSPVFANAGDQLQLITHGADFTMAYDPADGRELWRLGGLNPPGNYHPTLRFVATPGVGDGMVVIPTAKRGPILAVKTTGQGDITGSDKVLWQLPRDTPDVPTPLVHGGLVYLCSESGTLTCVDAQTGERFYRKRTTADRHRASPVYAAGAVYLTSRGGVVTVVRAGKQFETVATNDLGEPVSSTPVIVDGTLYLRSFEALYAIRDSGVGG
ncbi:MAG: PQQ-binding-like beta-propeller repeat protein [Planctomycetota bacterium]